MTVHQTPNLLFEMLRSFVELANSLNLSRATEVTGITRQTLKRHISNLEELRGAPLFDLVDRRYVLTSEGEAALPEAKALLERSVAWVRAEGPWVEGLQKVETPDGLYSSRQLPLRALWEREGSCTAAYDAWSASRGILGHKALDQFRPRLVVFRPLGDEWVCVWLGAKSVLAEMIGDVQAGSAVGMTLNQILQGFGHAHCVEDLFDSVNGASDVRLDRVRMRAKVADESIDFMRLSMLIRFPDGSTGVAMFSEER